MRQARRTKAHASARAQRTTGITLLWPALDAECFTDDGDDGWSRDLTCRHCDGTGGDRWNDGITPCEHCDGEGYEWWQ